MPRHPSFTVYTMSEVIITVRGESERRVAPERAVAHVTATADGPERGAVVERIAALAEPVRTDLDARKSAGRIADWSSQRVSVWADRPWRGAIDRSAVEPLQIADLGLLGGSSPEPPAPRMFARAAMTMDGAGAAPAVGFRPDDIVVTAAVEARFRA